MVSTVQNTDVKQKESDGAVVVAVTCRSVFEPGTNEDGGGGGGGGGDDGVYGRGVAFPLLQALQKVNERLLEKNPAEALLFDVVLVTTDTQQQKQSAPIISSTRHYGLEVGRFCFSSREDFTESLRKHNVGLFLTTDGREAEQAAQGGVLSVLLDPQVALSQSDQLRVLFCEEDSSLMSEQRQAAQKFSSALGEMRRRFSLGLSDSPLCLILMTSRGDMAGCGSALRVLRARGLPMDEAYCLAGAPRGPMVSLLRPHILLPAVCQHDLTST